jgi:hypothetical protein
VWWHVLSALQLAPPPGRSRRRAPADPRGPASPRCRLRFYSARSSPATRAHPLGSSISPSRSSSRRAYPAPRQSLHARIRLAAAVLAKQQQARLSTLSPAVARLCLGGRRGSRGALAAHPCSGTRSAPLPTGKTVAAAGRARSPAAAAVQALRAHHYSRAHPLLPGRAMGTGAGRARTPAFRSSPPAYASVTRR